MNTFWSFWQQIPMHIDPVLLNLGSFQLRWYSLGWITAFAVVYLLTHRRLTRNSAFREFSKKILDDFFFFEVIGVLVGARLGYVLFYNFGYYMEHPFEIILPFSTSGGFHFTGISGMSYHGGVLGGLAVFLWYARRHKIPVVKFLELFAAAIPLGYVFGRLGNFMNGELYGRVTSIPWGMTFYEWGPSGKIPFSELRHPSQLYEALLEGVLCGLLLWSLKDRVRPGIILSLYFISYGAARFVVEFFRQPDIQFIDNDPPGTVFLLMTMGQLLCLGMVLFGLAIMWGTRHMKKAV
ncbi:MAG: prolipoprotein diacylglyceryl transferase [Spirochaetes bacterium]|nr:prolipoprotein diacylglyceryl transferase [Spirochaetota bacterium]